MKIKWEKLTWGHTASRGPFGLRVTKEAGTFYWRVSRGQDSVEGAETTLSAAKRVAEAEAVKWAKQAGLGGIVSRTGIFRK